MLCYVIVTNKIINIPEFPILQGIKNTVQSLTRTVGIN